MVLTFLKRRYEMPIPKSHLTKLEKLLYPHELLVKLGRDRRILMAIEELRDNPKARDECKKSPAAFAKARGIALPRGAKIVFKADNWSAKVSVTVGKTTVWGSYDSSSGFDGGVDKAK
jgi:hypothetical protein